jgi:tetratricopeptide (TPR) repeat protein
MMVTNMIERHYDDEALISLIETNRAETDAHLPSCQPCSAKIESFRMIADALCDQDVWDARPVNTEPVPATIANLRAFADRMTDEDTRAEMILQELLAGSREEWLPRLREHPEWRTAGVVRKLIAASYAAVFTMPPDAAEMTSLATALADHLQPSDYQPDTVERLSGGAWLARAYALYYVGNFPAAEAALFTSQSKFSSCVVNEYELARVGVVRALVLKPFERLSEATLAASDSARTFERFGDLDKTASAKLAQAHVLFARTRYAEAEQLLLPLERQLATSGKVDTHARVLANLGLCNWRLGKVEASIHHYDCASTLLSSVGARTETVRIQWTVAVMLAEAGKVANACERLRDLTDEMEHLGMTSEAAVASLDVAEFLLAQNRYEEVEEICRSAMKSFELAGLAYTPRAMTALAYIREAAEKRRVDRELVRTVREYIRKLPAQPNLLFAPSPD